jgi:acyl carrier protein
MAPSLFVELDHLPLTQNGKLDRRALPEPERRVEVEYVAPGNAVEEVLTDVWRTVLGLKQVGVKDNFFELGGHSLLATQIVSQVKEIFDVDLPLRNLFETPTISGLALTLVEKSEDPQAIKTIAQTFIELQNLSEDEVRSRLLEREKAVGAT